MTRALVIGSSDGIGLALSKRLVGRGWRVTGVSRRESPFASPNYDHVVVDVTAAEYRATLQVVASGEPFELCVYCAAIGDLLDLQGPHDLTREAEVIRVNLVGAVETVAGVVPSMIGAGRGHFVGLSSIGDGVSKDAPSYAASKAGLSSYLGGLALALRPHGVRVTNLRFGFVDTKLAKSPVRPFMITVDKAVDVIERCIRRRPARWTYPKRMAALVWLLGMVTSMRLIFG